MTKILITGRPGCGKTTTIKYLAKQGFTTFNTDDVADATVLQNMTTGEVIPWPKEQVDWTTYAWNWQRPVIERLLATSDTVILAGTASNQVEFYPLFDYVFVMMVSPETLRHHLERHEHESHHLPGVIDRKVTSHAQKQEQLLSHGGIAVNGDQPTADIARDIVEQCHITSK